VKRYISILLIIFLSICLTGCWDKRIYEKIGFILIVGVEKDPTGGLIINYTSPAIGTQGSTPVQIIQAKGRLLREARENARLYSPINLEGGKIQTILISKELAYEGLQSLLDVFERDPTNPALAHIAIVDGSPSQLLHNASEFKDKPLPAIYLNQLLVNNTKLGTIPEARIWSYDKLVYTKGIDPILPILKSYMNEIHITGTALFHKEKYVGALEPYDTKLLLAMMNKAKNIEYFSTVIKDMESNNKGGAAIALKVKKRSIKVVIKDGIPVATISINFDGNIDEYDWDGLTEKGNTIKLQEEIDKEISGKALEVLKKAQEYGSDPVGIGHILSAKDNKYFEKVDWDKEYKKVEFKVQVKVKIIQYGVIN